MGFGCPVRLRVGLGDGHLLVETGRIEKLDLDGVDEGETSFMFDEVDDGQNSRVPLGRVGGAVRTHHRYQSSDDGDQDDEDD